MPNFDKYSMLRIYNDSTDITLTDLKEISAKLNEIGVLYFQTSTTLENIDYLKYEYSTSFYDIVFLNDKTINYTKIRNEFIKEHTHTDFEMRLITHGTAKFYINHNNYIYEIEINKSDLISIPAYTKHWFDAGDNPNFTAVRFYTDSAGWVATYT